MYRIRSASGNEVSYNSLEEFSAAVRRGEVHPEDEIFHTRANRWLDVKSHPHYRSAMAFQHHEPAAAAAVKPAAPGPVQPAPSISANKAQVFERPVVRTAPQTTVRPQLQPEAIAKPETPAAPEPEAPRPKKTKDLEFIDVGDVPGTKPMPALSAAPVITRPEPKQAPAPAPQPAAPPVAKTAPAPAKAAAPAPAPVTPPAPPAPPAARAPAAPDTEAEFLVMDGGIESPVRTSAGYKTVPEDLGLLFDAPLPKEPAAQPGHESPAASAAPRSAKAEPAKPSAPAAEKLSASVAARGEIEPDLETLPATLLEAPAPAPAEVDHPSHPTGSQSSSKGMLFGGGAAMVVLAIGLLAWRPWKSDAAEAPVAQPTASGATTAAAGVTPSAPGAVAAPAPMPIRTQSAAVLPAATKPAAKPADSAVTPAEDSSDDEKIIAASKPSFKTDIAVPAPTDFNVAGVTSASAAVAPSELVRRLTAAERQAQQELNTRLTVVGYRNVLSTEHLGSAAGVASAKAAWSAGADAIRQYRGRIARLERAYEDSVLSSQRAQRWSGDEMRAWASRTSLSEPTETSQLADLMFSQVNEGLDILAALSGEYTLKGQTIAFKNAASATRYTSIRNWVAQRTSTWEGTPESARPYSVTAILRALGEGFPAAQ